MSHRMSHRIKTQELKKQPPKLRRLPQSQRRKQLQKQPPKLRRQLRHPNDAADPRRTLKTAASRAHQKATAGVIQF